MGIKILNLVCAEVWGGGEQYVYDICAELKRRGMTGYVAVDESNKEMQQRYREVSPVLCADLYHMHGFFALGRLRSYIREYGITFVYCHSGKMMPLCLLLKRLTGVKLIFFKHNTVPSKFDCYHTYMRKHTDATICVSGLVYELQTGKLSEAEKRKFHLVYNGIDPGRFGKYDRLLPERTQGRYVVGYAGRMAANKGLDILVAAMKEAHDKHKDIVLQLAGADEDNYYRQVASYIKQYRMEEYVTYTGLERDMEKFYKGLDLFILPSSVREAFGLALCEAMYCGVPVVTSANGAQGEIITDGVDGMLLQEVTAETLEQAVLALYADPAKGKRLAAAGRETILRRFTIDKTVDGLLEVQRSLE